MLPKSTMAELTAHIRDACEDLLAQGGGSPRAVAEQVQTGFSDLCQEAASNLILDRLTDIARKQLKEWSAASGGARQMVLPGFPEHLAEDLPRAVAVPVGKNDYVYRPLMGAKAATLEELQSAIDALESQIAADQRRFQALQEFLAYRMSQWAA